MYTKLLKKVHCLVNSITHDDFFIVGGAVVNVLYGKEPRDYDCVLCTPEWCEVEAFNYLRHLSRQFAMHGAKTCIYQAYGQNLGEAFSDDSFQSMFLGCMKVTLEHCHLDILLSRAEDIVEHVQHHDCNMNMVWYDGRLIRWEHGGNEPKVARMEFREGVSKERINYMNIKRHTLCKHWNSLH